MSDADRPHKTLTCRLIQGDCLKVLPQLPAHRFMLAFCDLPYAHKGTTLAWDKMINLDRFWAALRVPMAKTSQICFTASMRLAAALIASNPKEYRYDCVFKKSTATGYLNAKRQPMRAHELMLLFGRGRIYNPQMRGPSTHANGRLRTGVSSRNNAAQIYGAHGHETQHVFGGARYPITIVDAPRTNKRGLHPTEKPVSLLQWVIATYSNEGDWILDPCSGSGVTAQAGLALKRNVVCVEKEKSYFDAAVKRMRDFSSSCDMLCNIVTEE